MDLKHYYNNIADYEPYAQSFDPVRFSLEIRRFQKIKSILRRINFKDLLDLGCGEGQLFGNLFDFNFNYVGMDISNKRIERAKNSYKDFDNATFVTGSATEIPNVYHSFDVVVCSELLEHVQSPQAVIKQISNVLNPRGYLILSVPNNEVINYQMCMHCHKMTPWSGHLHSFSNESLASLLIKYSLEMLSFSEIGSGILNGNLFFPVQKRLPYYMWNVLDQWFKKLTKNRWIVLLARNAG